MVVFGIIIAMIIVTVFVAAICLAPRVGGGRIIFDVAPDHPKPFGYKMAWLAIRTRDTARVVQELGLGAAENANWNTGLGTVYSEELGKGLVYVAAPVNGWTFVVGLALPQPLGGAFVDKATPLLVDLGTKFIEVQYYASCPDIDYFAWARVIDGNVVRAFAVGDEGALWNTGKPSKEEKSLGLKLFQVRGKGRKGDIGGELVLHPSEDHVMRLAAKWSLDPTRVNEAGGGAGLGIIARAPVGWRPVRLRQTG